MLHLLVRLDSPSLFQGPRRGLCCPTLPGGSPKTSPCRHPGGDGGKHPVLSSQSSSPPFPADTQGPHTVPSAGPHPKGPASCPASRAPCLVVPRHTHTPAAPPAPRGQGGSALFPPASTPRAAASTCPLEGRKPPHSGARPPHLLPSARPGTPRLPPRPPPRPPGALGSLSVKDPS